MKIILGQGIAGSILAWRFYNSKQSFQIIDNGHKNSSSMVAAGLWNPIVFRKINKSWMADKFIPELESFYPSIQEMLGIDFYHSIPIRRIHASKNELDLWYEKKSLDGFAPYLDNPDLLPIEERLKQPQFGEGIVRHGGYLDLPTFLNSSRDFFVGKGLLQKSEITDEEIAGLIEQSEEKTEITQVIDCRGFKCASSSYWNYLPFGLTKGEVLTIKVPNIDLQEVYNAGFFLVPLGGDVYRLGATFEWDSKDEIPTQKAKSELLAKFCAWFKEEVEILEHQASIRPTVQDRKPLFGRHPKHDKLYIFNGLGTKGVMLAPYLSKLFQAYLNGEDLPHEVNIDRFKKYYGEVNPQVNYPTP
jgi:glycine/D-amino acid oxidase-like deaminating enzyme